jgi:hypothetical protein
MNIPFEKSKRKQLFFSAFVMLFLLLFSINTPICYAGWFVTETQSDNFGNISDQSLFIENSKIRIENSRQAIVIDVATNEITLVLFAEKVFWRGNADTLQQGLYDLMRQKIMQLITQLPLVEQEIALKELDEQLAYKNAPQNNLNLTTYFVAFDTIDTKILNYSVSAFDFFCDSTHIERIWLSDEINPFEKIDKEQMTQMMQVFTPPTSFNICRNSDGYKEFTENKFVLKSEISTPYGKSITEVGHIRNMAIPEHIFMPPEDYRSILIEELGMLLFDDEKPNKQSNKRLPNLFENNTFDDW